MESSDKAPEMIIIAGPNGSGKTTITTQFLHHDWSEGILYINPDIIAQQEFGDWNSAESVLKAAQYCEKLREDCLQKRRFFVFETVFSAQDKLDFILRAKAAGYFSALHTFRLFFFEKLAKLHGQNVTPSMSSRRARRGAALSAGVLSVMEQLLSKSWAIILASAFLTRRITSFMAM